MKPAANHRQNIYTTNYEVKDLFMLQKYENQKGKCQPTL